MSFDPTQVQALIAWAADRAGLSVDAYIENLVAEEGRRLFYLRRTLEPKQRPEPRPIGRPPTEARHKLARQTAGQLEGTYYKLKQLYGDAYEGMFGAQEREWRGYVEAGDVDKLVEFAGRQPWQRRR